jgi:ergothioneine biosynthesis protein EgtB
MSMIATKSAPDANLMVRRLSAVRQLTEELAAPLSAEDQCIQSMADASPVKWHLAHTTWFFETLLLMPHAPGYEAYDRRFHYLFNSYYESLGDRHPRPQRGMITRPSSEDILRYRKHVDSAILRLLDRSYSAEIEQLCELGLQHEQQHQELILTDIKHALSCNPFWPAYSQVPERPDETPAPLTWRNDVGGIRWVGSGVGSFAFDNEQPRHRVLLAPFRLASRLTICGEYLEFIRDRGYERAELWLSDGWNFIQTQNIRAPLYWTKDRDEWAIFTLGGIRPLRLSEPVVHISFYEADAYARWCGKRLPTEFEWETAAGAEPVAGHLLQTGNLHPEPAKKGESQFYGDAWEWTRSAYDPYPGFKRWSGTAAEYNGKFMCGQIVLRGGSCVTPADHIRPGYRNFFPPGARWQFAGIRLAGDA